MAYTLPQPQQMQLANYNATPNHRAMPMAQHAMSLPRQQTYAYPNQGSQSGRSLPPYDVNGAFYAGLAMGQMRAQHQQRQTNQQDLALTWMDANMNWNGI